MARHGRNPRVLIITPEITALPPGMGRHAETVVAKAGGMADVSAGLVSALFELGADVHVALPNYRRLFSVDVQRLVNGAFRAYRSKLGDTRIHFAEDRIFYHRPSVYSDGIDRARFALVFQREVINHILPMVEPDLIHCHDWMTGLIPALARRLEIPCLFTVHNIHTYELTLGDIEDSGIDIEGFWRYLYYIRPPHSYEESRRTNRVDPLASGIFAAHFMNTVSPTFLEEILDGWHDFVPDHVRREMRNKVAAGCGAGILNAPSEEFSPRTDEFLERRYAARNHVSAKRRNKRSFQHAMGLEVDDKVPLFFWPSRLDPTQKGCELLSHILYELVDAYRDDGMQVAVVADGPFLGPFRDIVGFHGLSDRVGVTGFDEALSHLGYAASDFVLMPSRFEPCGLPQMIGMLYGALPIVRDTGGLHDTVNHLDVNGACGNGFVFETYDCGGLRWAVDQAMQFYRLPAAVRASQVTRIMIEASRTFDHSVTARQYFDLYERMLERPLVVEEDEDPTLPETTRTDALLGKLG